MTVTDIKATRITVPVTGNELEHLKAGDQVLLSGVIITGRDAAHKRLVELIDENKPLPVELNNQAIYYVGPCPARDGQIIGSCGPTTSGRVDIYTLPLMELGLKIMIGKGMRSQEVIDGCIKHGAVYLAATGGAGALISKCVKKMEVIAFDDLGTEAIHRLYVEDMPLIVAIDTKGNDLLKDGPERYRK